MIKVVFMGTPDFSVQILKSLLEYKEIEIVGVVSQPDKLVGRKKILTATPVSDLAVENNIRLLKPKKIKEEYEGILALEPDLIITAAYGQIIPSEILDYPRLGCINVHASLLPKYRGGAPIEWSIINGDKETGITIMYMDKLMDNGDIIAEKKIPIMDEDNKKTLTEKLSILAKDFIIEVLPSIINGTNDRIKQDESKVTFAYNISRDDEHISFNKTAKEVFNHVRGISPKPGGYVKLNGKTVKIYNGYVDKTDISGKPGEIIKIYKDGIGVKCKDYIYVITDLQNEGKKRTLAKNYVNGASNLIGEIYE